MAYTDFSRLQEAIQQAFNTYWSVRERREQRGENEKDRQARMQEIMMTLQSGRLTAQERNQAEAELEALRGKNRLAEVAAGGEEERKTRREFPGQFGPSNINVAGAAEEKALSERKAYQLDRLKRKVEGLTNEILKKIDDEGMNWAKIKEAYSTFFGDKIESWQWDKLKSDPMLAQDFVKKNVAQAVMRAYTNNEYEKEFGTSILYGQDLDNLFEPWIKRPINWGEPSVKPKPKPREIAPPYVPQLSPPPTGPLKQYPHKLYG